VKEELVEVVDAVTEVGVCTTGVIRYLKCVWVVSPLPVQVIYGSSIPALSSAGACVLVHVFIQRFCNEFHADPSGQQAQSWGIVGAIVAGEGIIAEALCLTQIFARTESETPVGQPQLLEPTVPTPHQPPDCVHQAESLPDNKVMPLTPVHPPIHTSLLRMEPIQTTFSP
jgi:hypothetical protein